MNEEPVESESTQDAGDARAGREPGETGGSPDGEARTLIYVHGRNCKPAAETLLELVLLAMESGLERDYPDCVERFRALDKRLAYYGDNNNELARSLGQHYDEQLDVSDCHNALQQLRALNKRKKFGLANYDRLPGKSAVPELAVGVALPLLRSIGLAGKFIGKVLPELQEYWEGDGRFAAAVRGAVRAAVSEALAAGEQVLLISHGTGSVVTWDVLWQLSWEREYEALADFKIDTWITLGAPLGDATIKRRLLGAHRKGRRRYPTNIVTWHNVSAEDDWLSHDNTLADDFRHMLQQKQVSAIRDYRIYNLAVRYGRSDPTSALGYLIHPRFAQILSEWLTRPAPVVVPTRTF